MDETSIMKSLALASASLIAIDPAGYVYSYINGWPENEDMAVLRNSMAYSRETPLPDGFWPTRLLDMPTGAAVMATSVRDLVVDAARYRAAVAVLPITEEGDRIANELLRKARARKSRVDLGK